MFLTGVPVTQRVRDVGVGRWSSEWRGAAVEVSDLAGGAEPLIGQDREAVSPALVGLAVDYLTRVSMGEELADVFVPAQLGADILRKEKVFQQLLTQVTGTDVRSVRATIMLSTFDAAYRAGIHAYQPVAEAAIDDASVTNVQRMVERMSVFTQQYGPPVATGMTFEGGGYTSVVSQGDADFLFPKMLVDMKVSKRKPQGATWLQLAMYWRMGLRCAAHEMYVPVEKLVVANPRLNKVCALPVSGLSEEFVWSVDHEVIGYR